jgi:uncharacterized membrane protein YfcA
MLSFASLLFGVSAVTSPQQVALAVCVGLIGGVSSGLCGVSPGGALVVLSAGLLGAEQHVAQGISLMAQIAPTGLAGIERYREEGRAAPLRWLLWLTSGFLLGGVAGATLAGRVSTAVLQWSYVGYLVALDVLLLVRIFRKQPSTVTDNRPGDANPAEDACRTDVVGWVPLLAIGLLGGLSSGYLGIGGGLAIVAGLTGGLKVPQHQAQMVSLVLSIIPTTIPAAYVYWRTGHVPAWTILVAVIVGLYAGTDLGARAANRMTSTTLRRVLVIMVTAMAAYMAWRAFAV